MRKHSTTGRYARLMTIALALLMLATSAAEAGERYYVLVFGSESHPKQYRYTHTWATFVRVVDDGVTPLAVAPAEQHTISWYPATKLVRVWAMTPETGVNMDLEETLDVVTRAREHIKCWGPFEITPDIYFKSLDVHQKLESGVVTYRAISGRVDELAIDCIHAVAAVDPEFGREHYPLIRTGISASRFMARQVMVRSPIDQRQVDASWLIPRLGLQQWPIEFLPPQVIPVRACFFCRCPD